MDSVSNGNDPLADGMNYQFQVRAVNDMEKGDWTTAVGVTPGVPTAPRDLTATPVKGGVTLNWTAPTYAGTPPHCHLPVPVYQHP